ncbi:MAG: hypothetical protein IJF71_00750, partial [Clostridia bacterium]|nr:hypothetical protein [Clostridia bacterium]
YILDYDPAYTSIRLELSFKGEGSLNVLLDGEIAYSTVMQNGKQSGEIDLVKANYEGIKLVFEGAGTVTYAVTFITKPYADAFSGSGFTITKTAEGETVFTYTYTVGWYSVVAPIRKYDSSYDSLRLSMLLAQPTVIGIMIDGVYLWSHYDHSEPVEGVMEFFFDLTSFKITDNSVIEIWIDPAITGYTGTEGTKTVTITELSFINTDKMPKASIVIAESFTFDYDGKGKAASGATTNSGETLVYEYKRASDADKAYSTDLPVDAGEYDVRVTSPLNNTYGVTYAYAKLFINKITPDMPKASEITVDYANEAVIYDASVLAVSRFEDFSYILPSGGSVAYGMTLYFKYIDSVNYSESAVNSVTLSQREGEVSFSINYALEITAQNVTDQQEYSTDGLNWTTGQNKKVKVVPGNIYLFRVKATDHSFAGEICYVAASYRPTLQNVQITLQATDKTSITVNPIAGAEYKLSDTIWQTDTYFGYLKAGDTVTVTVRLKATDSSFASDEISAEFTVGGEKEPEEKPGDEKPADKGCGSAAVPVGMMLLCGIFVACQQRRRVK